MSALHKIQVDAEGIRGPGEQADATYGRENVNDLLQTKSRQGYSERLSAISHFTTDVASQVNDCLTPIICYAQLISQGRDVSTYRDKLQKIIEASYQAKRVMDGLLDFSAQQAKCIEEVRANQVVKETVTMTRELMGVDEVNLQLEMKEDLPAVSGDPHQLVQALMNLLRNAVTAAEETGGEVKVRAYTTTATEAEETEAEGAYLAIEVSDTGPGIDPKHLPKVLLPFYTTRGSEGCAGLGLSIVYGVAQAHGGDLVLESEPGRGTKATLLIPTGR